jgi:UDP-glucose 4-epimerase
MAAESRIMNTINDPIKCVRTNSLGTSVVLQCSREAGCRRLVYSSTSSVYGENHTPNNESQHPDCLNPYSSSKYSGEMLCKNYSKIFGMETIILRYFNVYGDRQPENGQYAPVTSIFLKQKRLGLPLTVVGDGLQRRDFVNVQDVVNANLRSATNKIDNNFFGTAFNVGTGKNHSILEVASWISKNIIFFPPRPGEMRETLADTSKIKSVFGWTSIVNMEEYVRSCEV